MPTDKNLNPQFQSSGLPKTWPLLLWWDCCIHPHKNLLLISGWLLTSPRHSLPLVLPPTLAHPAPSQGVTCLVCEVELRNICQSELCSLPIIQTLSVFRSGTDLMNHLAQMNRLSPREVKWFIQVYAVGGSQVRRPVQQCPKI